MSLVPAGYWQGMSKIFFAHVECLYLHVVNDHPGWQLAVHVQKM